MSRGKIIRVSESFWGILDKGHETMNRALEKSGKKITFIDYSEILAKTMRDDLDIINKPIVLPVPRGKRRTKLRKLDELHKFNF
jgi:hypothetical protein